MPGPTQTVGGRSKIVQVSFTRPADTTTYASGDVISNSTTASTVLTFEGVAHTGGSGIIQNAMIIDSSNQATKLECDLFLFDTAPESYGNDNAAFTPTDAELLRCIGVINFPASTAWSVGDATSGASGNAVGQSIGASLPFRCTRSVNAIYGVLVARNAYVPISANPFYISLNILQD